MSQIVRDRVSDQVHRYLRNKIIDGELVEGQRLVEVEIAAELGVSRTPVREALWHLKSMDLIRAVGTGGYEVTNVKQELLNILDIRAALEAHAVRRAAIDISEDQLARLADICDQMEHLAFDATDKRAELNHRFHEDLIRASGNERLLRLVGDYQEYFSVAQPLFDQNFIAGTQREHRAILASLYKRDGDAAAILITEHILGAAKFLETGTAAGAKDSTTKEN